MAFASFIDTGQLRVLPYKASDQLVEDVLEWSIAAVIGLL